MTIMDIYIKRKSSSQLLFGISLGLALLLLITFFYVAWEWRNDWQRAHQALQITPTQQEDTSKQLIASLPKAHLFGQATQGDMPISQLQLRVTGIVKTTQRSGHTSKAYISMAGQPSKVYQLGDSLPYGVKVYDILEDSVILENNGHLEKLPLPRAKLEFRARGRE